jgi:peptidoglycan/xylan/chitin deacetylase (PgdA/CDA1 family)
MPQSLTVVMYHYVRDYSATRYPGIKGLDVAGFRRQLDYLESEYSIVRMEDVIAAVQDDGDLPENAALLTFDDGYAEHFHTVFPILYTRGLQGSFFPPVAPVHDRELLDVNRVHFILASGAPVDQISRSLDKEVDSARDGHDLKSLIEYRDEWAHANRFDDAETIYVKRMLQTALPEALRNEIARKLFAEFLDVDEPTLSNELYMTTEQIQTMVKSGMFFGSHGSRHLWLNLTDRAEIEEDVDESIEYLAHVGMPTENWVMCYPFGGYNDLVREVVSERGASLGFSTEVRTAELDKDDRLTLPRYDTNDFPQ